MGASIQNEDLSYFELRALRLFLGDRIEEGHMIIEKQKKREFEDRVVDWLMGGKAGEERRRKDAQARREAEIRNDQRNLFERGWDFLDEYGIIDILVTMGSAYMQYVEESHRRKQAQQEQQRKAWQEQRQAWQEQQRQKEREKTRADDDPYEVLGLSSGATWGEIQAQGRRLELEWHPDKNKSPDANVMFIKVRDAYEKLKQRHTGT